MVIFDLLNFKRHDEGLFFRFRIISELFALLHHWEISEIFKKFATVFFDYQIFLNFWACHLIRNE